MLTLLRGPVGQVLLAVIGVLWKGDGDTRGRPHRNLTWIAEPAMQEDDGSVTP